jgi:hypothetical protein
MTKCVGVDSGLDKGEVIVNPGIGSHTPCFSLDSASVNKKSKRKKIRKKSFLFLFLLLYFLLGVCR